MPVFTAEYLHKVAYSIYLAKGTPEDEAEIVATHQVKANLVGHDSHGVIHIPEYCERIDKGHIVPRRSLRYRKGNPNHCGNQRELGIRVRGHRESHANGHR